MSGLPDPGAEPGGQFATGGLVEGATPLLSSGCVVEPRTGPQGGDGLPAVGSAAQGTAERESISRALVERFEPSYFDADYRAEMERGTGRPLPEPSAAAAMVSFIASDGHRSIRPLTFGEVADAVLAAGYRRLVEDEDTIERVMWACAAVDDYLPGEMSDAGIAYYTAVARAAVRALREGNFHRPPSSPQSGSSVPNSKDPLPSSKSAQTRALRGDT